MSSPGGWTYRVALDVLRRRLRRGALEEHLLRRVPGREPPPLTDPANGFPVKAWFASVPKGERVRTVLPLGADGLSAGG